MKTPYDKLAKIYTKYYGHMTKMAATPIYGKNPLKIFFSRTSRPVTWDLVCSIGDVGPTKFVQMMNPRLTLTYLTSRSNLLPNAFKWDFFLKS